MPESFAPHNPGRFGWGLSALLMSLWIVFGTQSAHAQQGADATSHGPVSKGGDAVTLSIGSVSGEIGSPSVVPVEIMSTGEAPSVVVTFLQYDPLKLGFVSAEAGPALPGAKIIESFSNNDVLSVIVYGGQETLDDGVFLKLTFDVLSGDEDEVIPLIGLERSAATPSAEALTATLLGGQIDLGCAPLDPPLNPDASDGNPAGVLITWEAPAGGVEYRVFRNSTPDSATAQAVSPWVSELSFLDETAAAPVQPGLGCGGDPVVTNFVYWVQARTEPGCESEFSTPTSGYRGKSPVLARDGPRPKDTGAADLTPLCIVLLVLGRVGRPLKSRRLRGRN